MQLQQKKYIKASPYDWPHDGPISTEDTALVLVDMQNDFCAPGGYMDHQGYDISHIRSIIPGLQKLLGSCREGGYQVYHTREGHRPDLSTLSSRELFRSRNNASGLGIGDQGPLGRLLIRGEKGHNTIPELYPLSPDEWHQSEPTIDKPGKGLFSTTDFALLLSNRGIRRLILAGVTTDVCVHTIMREANDRGMECLIVSDGCAAANDELHRVALESVKAEGGVFGAVARLEDVLAALH
ncbi:hypothetical protein AAFC00_007003 [Neodothiora populina]|uniref:Isochorismatase-like domain-containing protein n=1 Tax=Neodothiora populina TaxID=2781224 RepID=A0ABR3PBZ9_9PEZI